MKKLENLEKRLADIQKEIETLKQGKPEFEVGKWYKQNNGKKMWFIRSLDCREQMSFGFNEDGIWQPLTERHSVRSEFHVATPTEIKESLEKEAVKRGFVPGAKIQRLEDWLWAFDRVCIIEKNGEGFVLDEDQDAFLNGSQIYSKGVWATVIKEQPLMIGGYEIVIHPRSKETTIDGHVFTKMFWEHAIIVSTHSKAAVYVGYSAKDGGANKWVADEKLITKILEKLK